MTNPALSISTTQQIGRLYQLPGGTYEKSISKQVALKGLANETLFPSITNVLNVLNKNLEGYAVYMMGKALREGKSQAEASKEYITYRDMAAERGTNVHALIEEYINAGNGSRGTFLSMYKALPSWPAVKETGGEGYMKAFINFCNTYHPKFIMQEATVYGATSLMHDSFNYAGTTDFIAEINGVTVVGDWKCTSKLHGSVARQMAAVAHASHYYDIESGELQDWDSGRLSAGIAVRLCADETFEVKSAELMRGWRSFQTLRLEWHNYAFGDEGLLSDFML